MSVTRATGETLQKLLTSVPTWKYLAEGDGKPDRIFKQFLFKDFINAFGYMSSVAVFAEKV